ncbi:MAG: serine/threonine-protein kinase [Rhodothermia bacterium]|nr:serine/threonine-protein kinase [Rhodothermia bacterium]
MGITTVPPNPRNVTGHTISHFKVLEKLGAGGMGVVYLAKDERLDRTVALKLLPPHALASQDDRARFYREARAAASLSHPNIAHIYEIDEAVVDGSSRPFIAMELIVGETLSERIARGPMLLKDAVSIATQIAEGLKAAHEKTIVHRDIKSGNIMLTADGTVKILDFGLAKTATTTKLTQTGLTLGTVSYMSPEQARGEPVDGRTDLWSLGVVLYEMISGRNPFSADYEQAVVYSILNVEPEPLTAVRTGVPMAVESVVERLLRKAADLRYPSADGVLADLKALDVDELVSTKRAAPALASPSLAAVTADSRQKPGLTRLTIGWWLASIAVTALVVWGLTHQGGSSTAASEDVIRSTLLLPEDRPLVMAPGGSLDLSSDGGMLTYIAQLDGEEVLTVYRLTDGSVRTFPETAGAANPRFSPDDRSIAFVLEGGIHVVQVDGGRPDFVAEASTVAGMNWLEDGYIYWSDQSGRWISRASPNSESEILENTRGCNCALPTRGPTEDGLTVSIRARETAIYYPPSDSGITLPIEGNHVTYLPSGHVVYTRIGALYASSYDPESGRISDDARIILDNVTTSSILRSAHYAVSDRGTLVYVAGEPHGLLEVVIRHPDGREEPVGMPVGAYGQLHASPNDQYLLIYSYDRGGRYLIYDFVNRTTRVASTPDMVASPRWSADSRAIMFGQAHGSRTRIVRSAIDSGAEDSLFSVVGLVSVSAVSPDGRLVAYRTRGDRAISSTFVHDLETDSSSKLAAPEGTFIYAPSFSPDGAYVVYTVIGPAGFEIMSQEIGSERVWKLSIDGGSEPHWLSSGDAIVYRKEETWLLVKVRREGDTITFAEPAPYFTGDYADVAGVEYAMLSGERAVVLRPVNPDRTVRRVEVITGFYRLLAETVN